MPWLATLGCGLAWAQPAAPLHPIAETSTFGPLRPPLSLQFQSPPEVPRAPPAPPRDEPPAEKPAPPVTLEARELRGRPDLDTVAEGDVQFRRGDTFIRADRLTYDHPDGIARATGNVRIEQGGNVFGGPELQIQVQTYEGFFTDPTYFFAETGGGGSARRVEFDGRDRARLIEASYSSCRADGTGEPAWLLSARSVQLDLEANEGTAHGGVLRFYGVPILAAPVLTFPLTDERKSGWLPPDISLNSKSGFETHVPYYWNIAPQRDATITPTLSTRRGPGIGTEFRYLEPQHSGIVSFDLLPDDRVADRTRHAIDLNHAGAMAPFDYRARVIRVSDDNYWKDFAGNVDTFTPRLLPADLWAGRKFAVGPGDASFYTRLQRWQILQSGEASTRIDIPPYQRSPQIGMRYGFAGVGGVEFAFESEFNRFTLPSGNFDETLNTGERVHALGSVARDFGTPGWRLTPRLSFNAAGYSLDEPLDDGERHPSRFIPTLSLDNAWLFERNSSWFGRETRQTLEPRLLYVYTPYRRQIAPMFDSAERDFNFESIFAENDFSGVDRVNDAHQVTAGVTTRLLDPQTGAEALRLGIVQRYLFGDQRITPENRQARRRFSDVLLLGSSNLLPAWTLDASVLYNPDASRTTRSLLGARYSPGPFQTVSATYRYTRGLSEQVELGWQWPIYRREAPSAQLAAGRASGGSTSCPGTFYGVGRINYSSRDARLTDAIAGIEYDAGCWIGRFVAERLSTGRSEATTRLLLQLELVGLSRLGTNPLKVLKDNIPGYRLLRDDDRDVPASSLLP